MIKHDKEQFFVKQPGSRAKKMAPTGQLFPNRGSIPDMGKSNKQLPSSPIRKK